MGDPIHDVDDRHKEFCRRCIYLDADNPNRPACESPCNDSGYKITAWMLERCSALGLKTLPID